MKKIQWFAVLLLTGCQTGPQPSAFKPGSTAPQRQLDYDQCKISSLREIPQAMATQINPGVHTPGTVTCNTYGTSTYCNEMGGLNIPASSSTYDANQGLRDRFIARCMVEKGYSIVDRPACPTAEARQKAAVTPQPTNPNDYQCTPGINMDG
ncbi:hypothetical protein NKH72_17020 [Mesorhizobium sp. M0955]|uniref:hypothetical protein n=1 Tax=Mesorhizobium sp. M0955 TaxID=2957033 RepID=UPI00333E0E78